MKITISIARLAFAALMLAAIAATFAVTAAKTAAPINPFNFFGFFTIQSNLIGVVALVLSAIYLLRDETESRWIPYFRACAVTYLLVVGLVYAALLAPLGIAGGVPLPWANVVLHVLSPIFFIVDWVLVTDRPKIPWRKTWVMLPYPVIWLVVVLIRGASDGWVPYPFLAPENGGTAITVVCVGIALTVVVVGSAIIALSRIRFTLPATMV